MFGILNKYMYKNVAFAQGLMVLVPKQQLFVSEFLNLQFVMLCR